MPNINDRIGSQNVIRVLSNASAPPTRLVNLTDVDSARKTEDGMILVWDLTTEKFFMTDAIDASKLTVTGLVTFTNSTDSSSPTTGALAVSGGLGVGKYVNFGNGLTVAGVSTFSSNIDLNASLDVLNRAKINGTFQTVGVTTLASSGGITTTGGDLYVGGDLFVADDLVYDEATARNWNVSGVATVGTLFKVLGSSELIDLRVGGASTFVGQSQFNSNVSIGGSLSIAGITSLASTGGITTTGGDLFVGGSFNAKDIVVSGIATFGTTSVVIDGANDIINVGTALTLSGSDGVIAPSAKVAGLSTFVGLSTFQNNVFVSGTLEAGLIDGGEY